MRLKITGRTPIRGTYRVGGSTSAAMTLLAGSLLTDQPITLTNVPDTHAYGAMLEVGTALGLTADEGSDGRGGTVRLAGTRVQGTTIQRKHIELMPGAILYLAPLLARRGHARISFAESQARWRPHFAALRDLGCDVEVDHDSAVIEAHSWTEREIILTQTSVTATAIACMLAAALGKRTTILNAASEPQIADLEQLLRAFGVQVEGSGSNLLTIHGAQGTPLRLNGGSNSGSKNAGDLTIAVSPDPVEAASAAAIAALTGGWMTVTGIRRRDLRMTAKVFGTLGIQISLDEETLIVPVHEGLRHEGLRSSHSDEEGDLTVESAPHPGFPSDLIGMATLIATQIRGLTLIHEKLYSNRLLFVDRLNALGAQIVLADPHRAVVIGSTPLTGEYLDSPDVRTGLTMLAAALIAEGETVIDSAETFERYFDHPLEKLAALGAKIRQV